MLVFLLVLTALALAGPLFGDILYLPSIELEIEFLPLILFDVIDYYGTTTLF